MSPRVPRPARAYAKSGATAESRNTGRLSIALTSAICRLESSGEKKRQATREPQRCQRPEIGFLSDATCTGPMTLACLPLDRTAISWAGRRTCPHW
ncbi:hypothetical protein VTN02DRAFT_3553 [Thermoascus thermophilus]